MITRSEEKASADDTHNAIHKASEAKQINLRAFDPKLVVYFSSHSWPEVMNIYHFLSRKQHHQLQGDVEPVQDEF